MCVKMLNMKTATIRKIQHDFGEVLEWIGRGEEVLVFRRKKIVARLLPPIPQPTRAPDFLERARKVWGRKPAGKRLSELASSARNER